MHELSDVQLLRDYAAHGNEAAFREIVNRHAALVYSSALRQVTSPDFARDVAQSIFTDLARKAPALAETLTENYSLIGWVYRSTRYTALNQLRNDRRRLARQRHVMQHSDPAIKPRPRGSRWRMKLCSPSELSDAFVRREGAPNSNRGGCAPHSSLGNRV